MFLYKGVGSDSASDDEKNEGIFHKVRRNTDNDSDEESDNALHERIRQRQLSRQQRRNFSSSESDSERGKYFFHFSIAQ